MRRILSGLLLVGLLPLLGGLPRGTAPDGSGIPRMGHGGKPGGQMGPGRRGPGAKPGPGGKPGGKAGRGAKPGGAASQAQRQFGLGKGNLFLRQGSPGAAELSFRRQLEANPDAPGPNIGLGKALARIGRCSEALDHFWPYVGTLPFGGDVALAASTCSDRLGLTDDALYFDHLAVELDPTSARALTSLALDLDTAGDIVGREEALDSLLFLRPDRDASVYARVVLALRAGDLDTFDQLVFEWQRTLGADSDMRRLQAQAWLDMDNPPEVLEVLAKVRRLRGGPQVRYLRAEALRRTGYAEEALLNFEDRPQNVLEGIDSDAILARIDTDLGDLAGAHTILARYEGVDDAELAASAWYLARAEGRTEELPGLAAHYERLRTSPLRELTSLTPWTKRD
jgi:hypothetical protein